MPKPFWTRPAKGGMPHSCPCPGTHASHPSQLLRVGTPPQLKCQPQISAPYSWIACHSPGGTGMSHGSGLSSGYPGGSYMLHSNLSWSDISLWNLICSILAKMSVLYPDHILSHTIKLSNKDFYKCLILIYPSSPYCQLFTIEIWHTFYSFIITGCQMFFQEQIGLIAL